MSTTETTDECKRCGDELDIESTETFKSVADQFWHRDCFAERCYESRKLVATPEGSFEILPVVVKEIENGKEEVLDAFWRAECPVCYRTHETDEQAEEVRTDLIDTVVSCCDTEWLPPADWIEDCDICGTSHRESRGCKKIAWREPFPHVEEHHFDCAECEWSGDQPAGPDGTCPDCDTTAVRAIPTSENDASRTTSRGEE
jgi:hypothetical protein